MFCPECGTKNADGVGFCKECGGKMKAKNAEIPVWTVESLGLDPDKCGLKGSPTQVVKVFSPEHRAGGEKHEGETPELAKKMIEILRERITV